MLKALEQARQEKEIGAGLEAKVVLSANGAICPLLEKYRRDLPALFIVSQVAAATGRRGAGRHRRTRRRRSSASAAGSTPSDVGTRPEVHPAICAECAERGGTVPAVNLRLIRSLLLLCVRAGPGDEVVDRIARCRCGTASM